MRELMDEVGIDPESTVQDLLDIVERFKIGADLWTSPRRHGHRKYRCVLYLLNYRLERVVMAEAATAWAALAAALIMGFEQGHLEWIE